MKYLKNIIQTYAGTGVAGSSGDMGPATSAQLFPVGISPDIQGNVFIADYYNNKIRKVDSAGIITTYAGTGGRGNSGDNGQALSAQLNQPIDVSADISGRVYIADTSNNKIRMVDSAGIITTCAGTGTAGFSGDGGQAISAQLNKPYGISADTSGTVYFSDWSNNKIRMISPTGIITTIADSLKRPWGVAADMKGNVYFTDDGNFVIRMVSKSGILSTVAGTGMAGSIGDGGKATSAQFTDPSGVAVDSNGNIYISDLTTNTIRMIDSNGIITTIAGTGSPSSYGDGGPATSAGLNNPNGVASDSSGRLYITEPNSLRIRVVNLPQPAAMPTMPTFRVHQQFMPVRN